KTWEATKTFSDSRHCLVWPLDGDEAHRRSRTHRGTAVKKSENMYKFGGAAGFCAALAAMASSSSDTEKPKEEINIDELSLYTTPQQKFHYVEPEKGTMEENVTTLRNMAEPYITWCQKTTDSAEQKVEGVYGVLKPKLDRTVQVLPGSLLSITTRLMAVGASMYYPQQAAVIAKSSGDAVYEFTLQAYVTVETLIKGKPAVKPGEKARNAEEKPTSSDTKA
ncbi:hypothetical protein AMELA_G00251510, partial [Ameiurus melas]